MAKRVLFEGETQIAPIVIDRGDYDEIERRIKRAFRDYIYLPLVGVLGTDLVTNSEYGLLAAIRTNRVNFNQGKFTGHFNAKISKELKDMGAKWSSKDKAWKIAKGDLPDDVATAVTLSDAHAAKVQARVEAKLGEILGEDIASKIKLTDVFERTMGKIDKDIRASMNKIGVPPSLDAAGKERIAEEYATNLKLSIQEFTDEQILELREKVTKAAFIGNRYETMVDDIRKSYGVSQNKAKFLARQETNLLMAKYKEVRYQDAGVNDYIWRCVAGTKQHPVRPMHARLNGKRFSFSAPPVTDNLGNRNNPGEDYNCRCAAVPIVKF